MKQPNTTPDSGQHLPPPPAFGQIISLAAIVVVAVWSVDETLAGFRRRSRVIRREMKAERRWRSACLRGSPQRPADGQVQQGGGGSGGGGGGEWWGGSTRGEGPAKGCELRVVCLLHFDMYTST